MDVHSIDVGSGIGLALTGMAIVYFALILVSLFIALLPRLLPMIDDVLPVVERRHAAPMTPALRPSSSAADEEVVAAIGFALHYRQGDG